jgi:hypothetical protein
MAVITDSHQIRACKTGKWQQHVHTPTEVHIKLKNNLATHTVRNQGFCFAISEILMVVSWHLVLWQIVTNISEGRNASIFMAKEQAETE